MKVQIRHVTSHTILGYTAGYFVRLTDGTTREFGVDYEAAHAFVRGAHTLDGIGGAP